MIKTYHLYFYRITIWGNLTNFLVHMNIENSAFPSLECFYSDHILFTYYVLPTRMFLTYTAGTLHICMTLGLNFWHSISADSSRCGIFGVGLGACRRIGDHHRQTVLLHIYPPTSPIVKTIHMFILYLKRLCISTFSIKTLIIPTCVFMTVRDHPFNLKGGGWGCFGGIFFSSFDWTKIMSLTWTEKKYSESTLCLKKYCSCRKKRMSVVAIFFLPLRHKAKKLYFDSEKNIG